MLWAVVFATAPGTVTLHTSDSSAQTFAIDAGVTKLSTPMIPGGYMRATLERDGATAIDLRPDGFTFNANPPSYNYNAFAAVAGSGSQAPSGSSR